MATTTDRASTTARQRFPLLFPPSVRPTSVFFGDKRNKLWTFEQPFITTTNIKSRMSVFKSGSSIVIYSPIAATPECLDMVKQTAGGLPTHIIMQSNAVDHTLFLEGWRKAIPSAQILNISPTKGDLPLLLNPSSSANSTRNVVPLPFQSTTAPIVEAALLDIPPFFQEVVLFHKPSKSILCADAIWRVVSPEFSPNVVAATGWKAIFFVDGVSRFPYWFYFPRRKRAEVSRFVEQVQGWGEIKRCLPGHLDPIPSAGVGEKEGVGEVDVKRVFLDSFDFILR
ncbi:hypothetical protein VYU27_007197 [Nannochloropsis oceanica]